MTAEIMTAGIGTGSRFVPADVPAVLQAAARYDVMALGPGLGSGQEGFVAGLLEAWEGPLIVDADGINAVAGPEAWPSSSYPTMITLTPASSGGSPGRRHLSERQRILPRPTGAVVLLKGISDLRGRRGTVGGDQRRARTGDDRHGDVLTGLAAALWARGSGSRTAARSAAYWHGRAGAAAASAATLTAEILANEIGRFGW